MPEHLAHLGEEPFIRPLDAGLDGPLPGARGQAHHLVDSSILDSDQPFGLGSDVIYDNSTYDGRWIDTSMYGVAVFDSGTTDGGLVTGFRFSYVTEPPGVVGLQAIIQFFEGGDTGTGTIGTFLEGFQIPGLSSPGGYISTVDLAPYGLEFDLPAGQFGYSMILIDGNDYLVAGGPLLASGGAGQADSICFTDENNNLLSCGNSNGDPWAGIYMVVEGEDACSTSAPGTPTDEGDCTPELNVEFCWTAANDALCGIDSYYVEVGTSPGSSNVHAGNVGNILCFLVDAGGHHGDTLFARVRAINSRGGSGPWSDSSDGILVDQTQPGAPAAPTDEGDCTASEIVTFYWTPADDAESGINSYKLQVGTFPGGNDRFDGNVGNVLDYSVVGIAGDTLYSRVQAVNGCDNPGPWSESSDGIILEPDAPTAPGTPTTPDLDGPYSTSRDVRFEWGPASAPSGIDSYNLQVGTGPARGDVFDANVGNVLTYTVRGGQGQTLYARAQAVSTGSCSTGAYSDASDPVAIDLTPPSAPGRPTTDAGCTSEPTVTFEWTPATDPQSGIHHYELEIGTTPDGDDVLPRSDVGNVLSYIVGTAGYLGQTLYARVRAVNNAGNPPGEWSGSSAGILVDTTDPSTPLAPTDAGEITTSPYVRFNWTAGNDPESGIASYHLQVGTSPGASDIFDENVGDVLTKIVRGNDGQTLYARVRSTNGCGTPGTFSPSSDGITIDTSAIIIHLQAVVVATPTDCEGAASPTVPTSLTEVRPENPFYLELWASQIGPPLAGLSSVFTDVAWEPPCYSAGSGDAQIDFSCVFPWNFCQSGWAYDGTIDELGACVVDSGVGVEPEWVLVASVEMTTGCACVGSEQTIFLEPASTPSAVRAVEGPPFSFEVPADQIIYGLVDLTILRKTPVINSIADDTANCGSPYLGPEPSVTEPDCMAPITWTLDESPAGMTIDLDTGVVSWPMPTVGDHAITIRGTNTQGFGTGGWTLTVNQTVPAINAIPNDSAECGSPYSGPTPSVTDPDCMAPITWTLDESPAGMTIDLDTGVVSWPMPTVGDHAITIRGTNTQGSGTGGWTLTVNQALGDSDCDGDVDLADFADFLCCAGKSSDPKCDPSMLDCSVFDFDDDNDVDLIDWGEFQGAFTGILP